MPSRLALDRLPYRTNQDSSGRGIILIENYSRIQCLLGRVTQKVIFGARGRNQLTSSNITSNPFNSLVGN